MSEQTKPQTVLVTRFCQEDMTSSYDPDFKWPKEGPASCDDWDPTPRCGGGLHGWLWGKGDIQAWGYTHTDVMLVVEVLKTDIVDLGNKVKFPKGTVVHCGTRESVTQFMKDRGHDGIPYGQMTVGSGETAEVGDYGIAVAGRFGTAIAGEHGTAEAGFGGTAEAGRYGTALAGYLGTAKVGDGGKAIVGMYGTAVAGDYGTANAANFGVASAGLGGFAQAGEGGRISIEWHDGGRNRVTVGYVGEDGIEANVRYRIGLAGKLIKVS